VFLFLFFFFITIPNGSGQHLKYRLPLIDRSSPPPVVAALVQIAPVVDGAAVLLQNLAQTTGRSQQRTDRTPSIVQINFFVLVRFLLSARLLCVSSPKWVLA
jgi:hypothetical protein